MKLTIKLVVVAAILVAVLIIGVYAVTVLFSQNVPSTTVKGPSGSPSATRDCSTLTNSPNTITLSTSGPTQGVMNLTCSGGAAFTVTSEGSFAPSFSCDSGCFTGMFGTGYSSLTILNYTCTSPGCNSWQTLGCSPYGMPNGYGINSPGAFVTLSKGDYVYCLGYSLGPYSTSSPTSLPSFMITWNSP